MANIPRKYYKALATDAEPVWGTTPASQVELVGAFNWYHDNKTEKDAAKYLGCSVPMAKDYLTLAWTKRMKSRGCILPVTSESTFAKRFGAYEIQKNKIDGEMESDDAPASSIQDRVRSKGDEIIGEVEGLVADFSGKVEDLNIYQWMIDNNVKPVHANRVAEHFRFLAVEPTTAKKGKDPFLMEAYERVNIRRLLQLYASVIKDAEKIAANVTKTRKPRKKKPVSFEKRVAKIKYLVKDDTLKVQSIPPVKVVGAQQLWVFNKKTRKLGVYNAKDAAGLSIKGSTLENFNEGTSLSKTVRKPEKVVTGLVEGGKIALRKTMDNIKAKAQKMNGRINKDTLLLRVV